MKSGDIDGDNQIHRHHFLITFGHNTRPVPTIARENVRTKSIINVFFSF